jgi:FtsH-binding integral membrane protein
MVMVPGVPSICCATGDAVERCLGGCSVSVVFSVLAVIGALLWLNDNIDALISFTLWAVVVIISIISVFAATWRLKKKNLSRGDRIFLIVVLIFGLCLPIVFGIFKGINAAEMASRKSNFKTEIPRYFIPDSIWR